MLRALLIALLLCQAAPAVAQRIEMHPGTVVLPQGYAHRPQQGRDSWPGSFVRADGGFTVHYDIGAMAGTHMGPHRRAECAWYVEHEVAGRPAWTGVIEHDGRRRIVTTIMDDPQGYMTPANFFAEVSGDRDVAEFMLIVASYVPKRRA
jgi:hypothetical protein